MVTSWRHVTSGTGRYLPQSSFLPWEDGLEQTSMSLFLFCTESARMPRHYTTHGVPPKTHTTMELPICVFWMQQVTCTSPKMCRISFSVASLLGLLSQRLGRPPSVLKHGPIILAPIYFLMPYIYRTPIMFTSILYTCLLNTGM